jgi:hypothetical protein
VQVVRDTVVRLELGGELVSDGGQAGIGAVRERRRSGPPLSLASALPLTASSSGT